MSTGISIVTFLPGAYYLAQHLSLATTRDHIGADLANGDLFCTEFAVGLEVRTSIIEQGYETRAGDVGQVAEIGGVGIEHLQRSHGLDWSQNNVRQGFTQVDKGVFVS